MIGDAVEQRAVELLCGFESERAEQFSRTFFPRGQARACSANLVG